MFQCTQCGATQFKLMLQPGFTGQVNIGENEHSEVVIHVSEKEFIADLLFMNQFALCQNCDATSAWAYYFPDVAEA